MAFTSKFYGKFFLSTLNKEVDIDTDSLYCALTTSSYTPDQDVHDYWNDVTNEVIGTGYTANGALLGSVTVTYTGATNVIMIDAADTSWAGSTITARNAIIYDRSPATDATRPLIMYHAESADFSTTNGTLTLTWNAAGLGTITPA